MNSMRRLARCLLPASAFQPSKSGLEAWTQHSPKEQPRAVQAVLIPVCTWIRQLAVHSRQVLEITGLRALPAAVQPFLNQNAPAPPVRLIEGMPQPTALSWLRRRGPEVPEGVLHRAFRKEQIRVFDGQRVKRVSASRLLSPGDVLLYPRTLARGQAGSIAQDSTSNTSAYGHLHDRRPPAPQARMSLQPTEASSGSRIQPAPARESSDKHPQEPNLRWQQLQQRPEQARPEQLSPHRHAQQGLQQQQLRAAAWTRGFDPDRNDPFIPQPAFGGQALTPGLVRSWVLGFTRELVFINKPFGLMVQGYKNTLEAMMDTALKVNPGDESLRLVHRLDRNVSGIMAVARSIDAAAWFAACLRDKASQVNQRSLVLRNHLESGRRRSVLLGAPQAAPATREVPEGMSVKRVYWAIVASDSLPQGQEGRMRTPVLVEGKRLASLTYYRVRHVSDGLAWVELTPQTGRRHQLRNHCARVLKAPIVGDVRYGYKGVVPSKTLARALPPSFWTTFSPRTAETVLNPPSRKERRQAAAAAARARAAMDLSRLELAVTEEDEEEEEDKQEQKQKEEGRGDARGSTDADQDGIVDEPGLGGRRLREQGPQMDGSISASNSSGVVVNTAAAAAGGAAPHNQGLSRAERVRLMEREVPLLLHSRSLTIQRPGKSKTLRVIAPLPRYMVAIFDALGWPLPKDGP